MHTGTVPARLHHDTLRLAEELFGLLTPWLSPEARGWCEERLRRLRHEAAVAHINHQRRHQLRSARMNDLLNLGPLAVEAPGRVFVVPQRNFKAVCEVNSTDRPYEVAVAYAHLFAAAPDLLDACKAAYSLIGLQYVGPSLEVSLQLAKAIAAAEGQP